ncbi:MAG: triose-phosphate isomerase [Rhodobacteraceae bacterium]|nr:triose-phosphate isomerase [Paracoccaceae bacterium]
MRQKLAAGNWKMNGLGADLAEVDALRAAHPAPASQVVLCPPATLLERMAGRLTRTPYLLGGQDCHAAAAGAHTGDIAAAMLADAGAAFVILGHSERREGHGETSAMVAAKARAARAAGLAPILCVGETEAERAAGRALEVLADQLARSLPDGSDAPLVVAYEPVWAIGSGRTPTPDQIAEAHGHLRSELARHLGAGVAGAVRLLYGGSVKAANAAAIFAVPEVDGALVGGAALRAADFGPVIAALDAAG